MKANDKETKQDQSKATQEEQIKHAIIDLLHNNESVTHNSLSKATGLSIFEVEQHHTAIDSMLSKLKKVLTSPNFKH